MVFNGPPHAVQEAKEGNYARGSFCKEHAIAYCETSMLQSYKEILHFLHRVSAPLREEIS